MRIQALRYIPEFLRGCYYSLVQNISGYVAARLRQRLLKTTCHIDTGVSITNPQNFTTGEGCALYHGTHILNTEGHVKLGNHSHLGALCYVNVCFGSVTVGDDVAIGPHTSIIAYSNHYKEGQKITEQYIQQDVNIGNNVFIGAHCTILPGAVINDNVVVGAGSTVKGTLSGPAIYAGSPCKKIRDGWSKNT